MGWSADSELASMVSGSKVELGSQNAVFILSNLSCFPNFEFSASHCT